MPWGHAKIGAAENTKKIKCCLNSPEAGMTRACRLCGSLSVHAVNGGREMAMVDGFGCVAAVGALIHHDGERQPSALTLSRI